VLTFGGVPTVVQSGRLAEADIDRSLARVLSGRFETGLFDPLDNQVRGLPNGFLIRFAGILMLSQMISRLGLD
jgi:hypothetical protein